MAEEEEGRRGSFPYWGLLRIRLRGNARTKDKPNWKKYVKSGIIALVIVALFVATIYRHKLIDDEDDNNNESRSKGQSKCSKNYGEVTQKTKPCYVDNKVNPSTPTVVCTGLNLETSLDLLLMNLSYIKNQGFESAEMYLTDTIFKNESMSQDWLPLTTEHPQITALKIERGNLKRINNNSFSTMTSLQKITLEGTDLTCLDKKGFQGLKRVKEFNLLQNLLLMSIEKGFLHEMTPETVQIENIDTTSIPDGSSIFANLSGDTYVPSVTMLDLETSVMPTFPANILPKFPNIQSLRIENCLISEFELNAFKSLSSLKQIYMEHNQIETLEKDIFEDIVRQGGLIYADGNPIICDCKMLWLQQFINEEKNGNYGDFQKVECSGPEELKGENFLNTTFCYDITTTTGTGTESSTTPKQAEITCAILESIKSKLRLRFFEPRFNIIESDDVTVKLTAEKITFPAVLIYFEGDLINNMSCVPIYNNYNTKEEKSIQLQGTSAAADYIFCLVDSNAVTDEESQEMDCRAHRTQPVVGQRAWLTKDEQATTLTYIGLVVLLGLILGAIIAFFVVRKRPTLLKGSRRVEIVKMRNREMVLVMPEKVIRDSPPTPSSVYDTISGYITPLPMGKGTPPPIPPIPPQWLRRNKEEHVYLEPCRYPKNMDLLLEYEWYTQRLQNEECIHH